MELATQIDGSPLFSVPGANDNAPAEIGECDGVIQGGRIAAELKGQIKTRGLREATAVRRRVKSSNVGSSEASTPISIDARRRRYNGLP